MSQITVIVPVYKVEPYLRRCVDSLLSQTFTDFDLVLIDDGSPDKCGAICDEYAQLNERVFVIHHKKNQGLSAARNTGINWAFDNSDSQWISFVDSDDWVRPIYLAALYDAAQGYDVSVGAMTFCKDEVSSSSESESMSSTSLLKTEDFFCCNYSNAVVAWGKLYKKYIFTSLRFPVGKIYEDTFTTHKILFRYQLLPFIEQPIYYYYHNPASITHCKWNPARLDELQATVAQISFFVRHNYLSIAKIRFDYFRKVSERSINQINKCNDLSDTEKARHIKYVRKLQRNALILCRRYKWCSLWNRGDDLWFFSNAFLSVHIVHMVWRLLKRFIQNSFSHMS